MLMPLARSAQYNCKEYFTDKKGLLATAKVGHN